MKKNILVAALVSIVLFQSCQNDDAVRDGAQNGKVILNQSAQDLSNRLDYTNSGVINFESALGARSADGESAVAFPMSLLAEVKPPTYQGVQLTASHVDVNDNFVYVSYNTQGDQYLGGIDVIDVSQPNDPVLIVSAVLPNIDISSVKYNNGKLYIAGAADVDAVEGTVTPAFVAKMDLASGRLSNDYDLTTLPSFVATDLVVTASNYYAVTGNPGVVAKLNKETGAVEASIELADLRAIGSVNNKIVILSGTEGVKILNASTLNTESSFSTSTDVAQAKRTIDFQGNNLIVAEGLNGMKVYNTTNGNLIQSFAVPTGAEGTQIGDFTTNAVSVQGDFVYAANGAGGVTVYQKGASGLVSLGSIPLEGSSNYVKSVGDFIFVATGRGGLKIIKKVTVAANAISCESFPIYNRGQELNVNSNETLNFRGSASIQRVNVNQNLTFCGSLSVGQAININSNGIFTMIGSLAQGANNKNTDFNVNGKFVVEGSVVIHGNLNLNSGATIDFRGSKSSITVHGRVNKNNGVTILGTYTDTNGKLKNAK